MRKQNVCGICRWCGLLMSVSTTNGQLVAPATTFSWSVGSGYYSDFGPFLDFANFGKYHLGEDWNAINGQDLGEPVYAVANGKVWAVQNIDWPDSWGKVVVIEHTLFSGGKIYSLYAHLEDFYIAKGTVVAEGELIGTIGNANGYYGPQNSSGSHLHFEIRNDSKWRDAPQGYIRPPLDLRVARRFKDPSLFIDDRTGLQSVPLVAGNWTVIRPQVDSSTALMFITYGHQTMTFSRAVAEKLVDAKIQYGWPGGWNWKNLTIAEMNCFSTTEYRLRAKKSGVTLNLMLPGHNFQTARAVQDIIWFASTNPNFQSCQPETIESFSANDNRFDFRQLTCDYQHPHHNTTMTATPVRHATNWQYPLFRFISYYDPETETWSEWLGLTPNQLDP